MNELQKIREEINKIDVQIAILLKKRLSKVQSISKIKTSKHLQIEDKKREEEILSQLETDFEKEIFKKILEESRKTQKQSLT